MFINDLTSHAYKQTRVSNFFFKLKGAAVEGVVALVGGDGLVMVTMAVGSW